LHLTFTLKRKTIKQVRKTTNEKTNELLEEILKWQKLQGKTILKNRMKEEKLFTNKSEESAYLHSDGTKNSREVSKLTGLSHTKIQALWKQWINVGIAEPSEKYKGGQCKTLFSLTELGIEN